MTLTRTRQMILAFACLFICALTVRTAVRAAILALDDPSVSGPGPHHVLTDQGPGATVPNLAIPANAMGLVVGDRIDALSLGRDNIGPIFGDIVAVGGLRRALVVSVGRTSRGGPGTAVETERAADSAPPAGGNPFGHPSDLFLWNGGAMTNTLVPAPIGWRSMNGDEGNCGFVIPAPGNPGDDVSAYDPGTRRAVPGGLGNFGGDIPPVQPVDPIDPENPDDPDDPDDPENNFGNATLLEPVFFSLQFGSPTLALIGATPGDILVVGGAFGNVPSIFVSHAVLGIAANVDLDSLALVVTQGVAGNFVTDRALYTVRPVSVGFALGGVVVNSGADVIQFDGAVSTVAFDSTDLGLRTVDDVDAMASILYQSTIAVDVVPFGGAVVEDFPGGFGVTNSGDEPSYGVDVQLPPNLSGGATFDFDGGGGGGGDGSDAFEVTTLVSTSTETAAEPSPLGSVRFTRPGDLSHIFATFECAQAMICEVLDGDDVVLSRRLTSSSVDISTTARIRSCSLAWDLNNDGAFFVAIQEIRINGGQEGEEFCVDGECAVGNRVRLSALCNNEVIEGVFFLAGYQATARGLAGFTTSDLVLAAAAVVDGNRHQALGQATLRRGQGGITVANIGSSGLDGFRIEGGSGPVASEIGSSGLDGVCIDLGAMQLWSGDGLLAPRVEISARLHRRLRMLTAPHDMRISLRAIGDRAVAISADWGGSSTAVQVTGVQDGEEVFAIDAQAGQFLRFEGRAELEDVQFSSAGFELVFATNLRTIDPRTGGSAEYSVLRFRRSREGDGAGGGAEEFGLDQIDVRASDVGDIQLRRAPDETREIFRRADTDGNGRAELSDAVRSLAYLFQGGPEPDCFDAADSNDDGRHDMADAVNTLSLLFLGSGAIPAPGPFDCGSDPTEDGLGCESYEACP